MGVMGCHRNNCENIMCNLYSSEFGYICYECFEELISLGMDKDIQEFMDSEKKEINSLDEKEIAAQRARLYFKEC